MNDIVAEDAALIAPSSPSTSSIPSNLPGRLLGAVTLTIHTNHGLGALLGRRDPERSQLGDNDPSEDEIEKDRRQEIFGINTFNRALHRIMTAAALDDIYAIQTLTEIDDLLTKAEKRLTSERRWLAKKMSANPRMKVQVAYSTDPRTFELDLQSPYAHRAASLIGLYDELAAAALSARRAGVITGDDLIAILKNPRRAIRSSFYKANRFRVTGVTLDDIKQANGRAVDAIAVHGEISPDIINGDLRPSYLH